MVFASLVLFLAFGAAIYGKQPHLYKTYTGELKKVSLGEIKVKPEGIKDFREWKYEEAVLLEFEQKLFVFIGPQYKEKRDLVLKELKKGQIVKITYRILDRNSAVYEINRNGINLLDLEGYDRKWRPFVYSLPVIGIICISLLIWTHKMRKNHLAKRNTYNKG